MSADSGLRGRFPESPGRRTIRPSWNRQVQVGPSRVIVVDQAERLSTPPPELPRVARCHAPRLRGRSVQVESCFVPASPTGESSASDSRRRAGLQRGDPCATTAPHLRHAERCSEGGVPPAAGTPRPLQIGTQQAPNAPSSTPATSGRNAPYATPATGSGSPSHPKGPVPTPPTHVQALQQIVATQDT